MTATDVRPVPPARDALIDLTIALYAKAIDLFDADNEGGEG